MAKKENLVYTWIVGSYNEYRVLLPKMGVKEARSLGIPNIEQLPWTEESGPRKRSKK